MSVGYRSASYVGALGEFGTPIHLTRASGWLLKRRINSTRRFDAVGCYPLFSCLNWEALHNDLSTLSSHDLVSVSAVIDPFGDVSEDTLRAAFPDVVKRFKDHFVTDLSRPLESFVAPSHRRNLRKVDRAVSVDVVTKCSPLLEDWMALYSCLILRHQITGISAFSPASFRAQLEAPGIIAFVAHYHSQVAGILLWFVMGEVAYYHLGAYSDVGYRCMASFALFEAAIRYFSSMGLRWACLGGGAGTEASETGLTRFKRGWATGTRPAYFVGRIFDRDVYEELCRANPIAGTEQFFPKYRAGAQQASDVQSDCRRKDTVV